MANAGRSRASVGGSTAPGRQPGNSNARLWEWSLSRSRQVRSRERSMASSGVSGKALGTRACIDRWCWMLRPTKGETGMCQKEGADCLRGGSVEQSADLCGVVSVAGCLAVKRDDFGRSRLLCQRMNGRRWTCALHGQMSVVRLLKRNANGIGGGPTWNKVVTAAKPG